MKNVLKTVGWVTIIYILIGVVFATHRYFTYDANSTSFPNDFESFLLVTFFWLPALLFS